MGDESWVYGYDPKTKAQSSQWKTPTSPRPTMARQSRPQVKVIWIGFFDMEGMVHSEFLPQSTTVNFAFDEELLKRLREAVRRKRPERWRNGWLFHHDNVPCHTTLSIRTFLVDKNIPFVSILLAIPQSETNYFTRSKTSNQTRQTFWRQRRLQEMFLTVEGMVEQVCLCRRGVLWKGLMM